MAEQQLPLTSEADKQKLIFRRIIALYGDIIASEHTDVLQFRHYLMRGYSEALKQLRAFERAEKAAAPKPTVQKGKK